MPNVTAPTRQMNNGDYISQFVDTVGTSATTYTYARAQDKISITNVGAQPLSVTVAGNTQVIASGQSWTDIVDFTTFAINAVSGAASFDVSAREKNAASTGSRGNGVMIGPQGPQGVQGPQGSAGAQGPAGSNGTNGSQGPQGVAGQGVPAGGTTGQILAKINATNYNTQWIDAPTGGGGSGAPHNVYIVDLSVWSISNTGTNATATTVGINNALAWAYANKYTYVKLPAGTYLISKGANPTIVGGATLNDYSVNACIRPPSDMIIDLYGCTLKKEVNGWEGYDVIRFEYSKNVTILGGVIQGDALTGHDFTSSGIHERNTGVSIGEGSRNITLNGVEVHSFAGYNVNLICQGSSSGQLRPSSISEWETGALDDVTGATSVDAAYMRMNTFVTLASLQDLPAVGDTPRRGTNLNGGIFYIQGNGYGTFGTRTDGYPFQLHRTPIEIYCYDTAGVYKGKIERRTFDEVNLTSLPTGTTKFKLAFRGDITQVIASTFMLQIMANNPPRGIKILNCKIHDSFSLAIAVTGAQQILVENCELYKIGWSTPVVGRRLYPFPMGIDIEDLTNMNQNIIIRNNRFFDLESIGISALHTRNLLVENNVFDQAGVVFQGSRGTNLISQNNVYHGCMAYGEGNPYFKNDTFIDVSGVEFQFESTYEDCLFDNVFMQFNAITQPDYVTNTLYDLGTSVLPITKNGFYYVQTTNVGTISWTSGATNIVVNSIVVNFNGNNIYKCTVKGGGAVTNQPTHTSGTVATPDGYTWQWLGASNVSPTWKTDLTDTTDAYGNVWKAWVYDPTYPPVTFKDCRINFTKAESAFVNGGIFRRGAVEYHNCKFNITGAPSGYMNFTDTTDYAGKNSIMLRDCSISSPAKFGLRGNKVTLLRCDYTGQKGVVEQTTTMLANEMIVSGCTFTNFDVKMRGLPNSNTKSLHFNNNILNMGKTVQVFGNNNEGIWITNFDNVFIENNKATITSSTTARPFTIWAEKYLKFSENFVNSNHPTNNPLELFGAWRDGTYTTALMPMPKTTSVIKDNYTFQYPLQVDTTYAIQLAKSFGEGSIDISSTTLGTLDRLAAIPSTGSYAKGQIIWHSAPATGAPLGWVTTTAGWATNTTWTTATSYTVNTFVKAGGNVYRCTVAGGSTSTNQPTGTSTTVQSFGDGYSWIYVAPLAVFGAIANVV